VLIDYTNPRLFNIRTIEADSFDSFNV
jgi:hypothetical protein